MFKFLLKDKVIQTIVDKITKEVNSSLSEVVLSQDKKFDTVISHLESLRVELKSLDQRLTSKEMKDKMDYGQMQYKISSLQSDLKETKPVKKRQARIDN